MALGSNKPTNRTPLTSPSVEGQDHRGPSTNSSSPSKDPNHDDKTTMSTNQKFIGEELVDWSDENNVAAAVKAERNDDEMQGANEASSSVPSESSHENDSLSNENPEASRYHQARRALGLDSRCLQSRVDIDICSEFNELVRSLASRGISPEVIAMTAPSSNRNSKSNIGIHIMALDEFLQKEGENLPKPLVIEADPHAAANHSRPVTVPKILSAKYSWRVLAEMVNAVVVDSRNLCSSQEQDAFEAPFEVTIVTTDMALFCDTNEDSHQKAVSAFLDRMGPLAEEKKVGSIRIVLAETGRLGLLPATDDTSSDDDESDLEEAASSFRNHQLKAVTKCVHSIQHEIRAKTQTVYHDDTTLLPSLDVQFTVIDHCSTGYKLLSRDLIQTSLAARRNLQVRLTMVLPELPDGTQCSVSFDASYQTMPVAMDSEASHRLWTDLQALADCSLELVQVLPHDLIDASLLFGLPLKLRSASFAHFVQTREMQALTSSLFCHLEKERIALLLSATACGASIQGDKGLFYKNKRTFILMPQVSADKDTHSGILFGYAQADDLFLEASCGTKFVSIDSDEDSPYTDYIERALDAVAVGAHNPLEASRLDSIRHRAAHKAEADMKVSSPVSDAASETRGLPAARDEADDSDDAMSVFEE